MTIVDIPKAKSEHREALLTQKQIADQLGVSRQLVSFALRGQGRMSDDIRERILELANSNGYGQYSNREARAMVSRRYGKRAASGILAVIFQSTFENQPVTSLPYFASFFEGLESEAIERGLDLALCALRPHDLPRLVREGQVDGVVGLLTPEKLSHDVSRLSLPIVNVMYAASGGASLIIDDIAGSTLATKHLLELGHRNIAYIGVERAKGKERLRGYRKALREYSVVGDSKLIEISDDPPSVETGVRSVQTLLARCSAAKGGLNFSALVCYNDLLAMGAVRALRENGFQVPIDVSVVGFDDVSVQYSFHPALTSISFSRRDMGRRAVALLCDQANAGERIEADSVETFPVQLRTRESTAPFSGSIGNF